MANVCNVCAKPRSRFILCNKMVCLICDDLLFDIEIECDDGEFVGQKEKDAGSDRAVVRSQLERK